MKIMKCIKCNIADNKTHVKCDGCERPVHSECSGLNASELKVMGLKGARSLKFFCDDCLTGLRMVPQLIKKVDDLRLELDALKRDGSGNIVVNSNDTVLAELQERQKRENNIMIFNLLEEGDDVGKVKEIFRILTKEDINMSKTIRVGKPNKNGIRALKIVLENPADAVKILKAKKGALKGRKIYVNADLTPMQYGNLKKLRDEVDNRKQNGENVILRYIKGVPQIVEDSKN